MLAIESMLTIARSGLGLSRNPADYVPMLFFLGAIAISVTVYKKLAKRL